MYDMKHSDKWQDIETAPRDGTWFVARTAKGYERKVHFSDAQDRFPIGHSDEAWVTRPVEWRDFGVLNDD
jgi:hypothetical protein